jgi:hypothetical protein
VTAAFASVLDKVEVLAGSDLFDVDEHGPKPDLLSGDVESTMARIF